MALFRAPDVKQEVTVKKVLDEAQKLVADKKFSSAKISYSKAIHCDPRCVEAYVGRARVFEQLYKESRQNIFFLDQAIADYSAVLLQNPHHVEALLGRALLYQKKGADFKAQSDAEMKKALQETKARKESLAKQKLGLNSGSKDAELSAIETYYADVAINEARASDAFFHMNKGLDYFPKNHALRFLRVQYYYNNLRNYQKALAEILQCIKECPSNAAYYLFCGIIYAEMGNREKGKEYCVNGMVLSSSLAEIPSGWREQCLDIFNEEKYVTHKIEEKLTQLKKDELIAKAQAAMKKADYHEAVKILNAAIWVKINDASLYILCAEAYLALGEYKAAYQHSSIAIWLTGSTQQEYFYLRAKALFAMGDEAGASWNFDAAIFSQDNDPRKRLKRGEEYVVPLAKYIVQLGVAASISDDFDAADKYFDMVERIYTKAAKFVVNLKSTNAIFTASETAALYLEHGVVHENRGNLNAAREHYLWAYVSSHRDGRVNAKANQFAIKAVFDKLCGLNDSATFKEKQKVFYAMAARLGPVRMKQAIADVLSKVAPQQVSGSQLQSVAEAPKPQKKKRMPAKRHVLHFQVRNRNHQVASGLAVNLKRDEKSALIIDDESRRAENKRNAERRKAARANAKASGAGHKALFALITEEMARLSVAKPMPSLVPKPIVATAQPAIDKKENEKKTIILSDEEKAVLGQLKLTDPKALFVGGALRQRWQTKKRSSENDIDIVTTATDEQILASLKEFGVAKNTHGGFTLRLSDNTKVDIHRSEHLKVSLKQDASMRDFTINALYADEHGNLIDELGTGIADLSRDTLVPISDAKAFFARDACNILRAYYVSLKSGKKLPATYEAEIKNHLPALAREADMKASRVNHKLMNVFFAGNIPEVFERLLNDGVIDALFKPAGVLSQDKDWIIEKLSEIFEDSPNAMLKHIYMIFLVSLTMQDPNLNDSTVYNLRRTNELFNLQMTGMGNFAKHYNDMVECWCAAGEVVDQVAPQPPLPEPYFDPQTVWQYMSTMQAPVAANPMMQFGMWAPAPAPQQVFVIPLPLFLPGFAPQAP